MTSQNKRADPGRSTLSIGALAGASMSNREQEMTMDTHITLPPGSATLTMSSREIAELTGKRHRDVVRDINRMLTKLAEVDARNSAHITPSSVGRIYLDERNREQTEFLLPKRECLILVSGYSIDLRAKIIDRWLELEAAIGNPDPALHLIDFADRARADNEIVRDLVTGEARNTRGAVIKAIRELAANPLASLKQYLDDRFMASRERDKMVLGGMQALGTGLAEVCRSNGAVVELARKALDVGTFIGSDWVTVQGVYVIAGVPTPVIKQRALSARVVASLTAYSFEVDRQMDVRCPPYDRTQRLYRAALVRDWLHVRGRALIDLHLAQIGDQKVIRFPGKTDGEGK